MNLTSTVFLSQGVMVICTNVNKTIIWYLYVTKKYINNKHVFQDDDDFVPDESAIECYTTPLDDKDCPVDEYVNFKNALLGKHRIYFYPYIFIN